MSSEPYDTMEDDGLDLSLNLNITSSSGQAGKRDRPKVTGTRKERIKQRKQIKFHLQKEKESTAEQEAQHKPEKRRKGSAADAEEDNDDSPPRKLAKKDDAAFRAGAKKAGSDVISSLFRHNPEIPAVKSKGVKGVKEDLFASTKFSDLPLHPHLISNLEEKLKLATMTRVQQMSIPVILREKDVLIKSQTGSGKTLAYAVPIVHTLASLPRKVQRMNGSYALVIVPTRELAMQSYDTFQKLLQSCVWIVAGCLMGGEKRNKEKARIRKGINILVSTPGRLLDHLQHTDCLTLHKVQWLVLDEADRLLELGYEKDIAQIVSILNERRGEERQTILLSATLTAGVERLAGMTLKDHESIDASEEGGVHSPADSVGQTDGDTKNSMFSLPEKLRQQFVMVPCKLRLVTLAAFVLWKCKMQPQKSKMVVFLNTQDSVEFHHQLFTQVLNRHPAKENLHDEDHLLKSSKDTKQTEALNLFKLHGDMAQKERTQAFQEFTAVSSGVLLCTDVAARGLHLPRVDWIVQYTTPGATVDYIHRVGRTARAGKQGSALLFLMPSEAGYVQELNKQKISLSEVPVKDILTILLRAIHDLPQQNRDTTRQMPRTYEEASTFMQDRFEESVVKDQTMQTLAAKGYQSFVRAYATYPSHLKDIFSMKDLHLGHVAKSFALRKAPSNLLGAANRGRSKSKGRKWDGNPRLKFDADKTKFNRFQKKRPLSSVTVSEFGSGLVSKKSITA